MATIKAVTDLYPELLEIPKDDVEFGQCIKKGQMSNVFKGVWKTKDDFPVVIQRLHVPDIDVLTLRKIKADEEKKDLGRKFIVEVLGVITNDPWSYCIVMEYAVNGSLFDYLKQRRKQQQPLEKDQFFTWTRQNII
ncbi:mitogen-activated protein kinase kinase kinase 20-like [Antedon mediterranea]|uniref:mitogen-activated protein kinase kinase kinase 20-like n=1 Tax=Antedon mediterranea TaxID=105859 RepID=UPI003AF97AF3